MIRMIDWMREGVVGVLDWYEEHPHMGSILIMATMGVAVMVVHWFESSVS